MSGIQTIAVAPEDAEIRLDRWFKRHFPGLGHGRLEKLLRTGQIRLDGRRAGAGDRIAAGQSIRVPPLGETPLDKISLGGAPHSQRDAPAPSARDIEQIQAAVLYRDDTVIVLAKPPGLAVQGGTNTDHHLDALLDGLRFGATERPRLVHRLDKDTSGVLVLARTAAAAATLAAAFRGKTVRKLYWAAVVGAPKERQGRIDLPLAKLPGRAGERVVATAEGKRAVTLYRTVAHAGGKLAWLALSPVTGRTHQLRAHCAAIGTPILGDGKYGGARAHPPGVPQPRRLHLHARAIAFPLPSGKVVTVTAPLPAHMRETWAFFGFEEAQDRDLIDAFADEF